MRIAFTLLLCSFLTACGGWNAVHLNDKGAIAPDARLGQIAIGVVYTVHGQDLYNALHDRLAKFDQHPQQNYSLIYGISSTSRNQTSFIDGSASLTLKRYTANYTLNHGSDSQTFSSTTTTSISTDNSPYNNTELVKKADEQAMEVLANAMIKRLAVFLRQNPNW